MSSQNLSHAQRDNSLLELVDKVQSRGDLPYASVEKQLELLGQLSEFSLGRFLIETGGLNGYWTQYIVSHPQKKKAKNLNPIEDFLLNQAPICLATQERFIIFKTEIQKCLKDGGSFSAIPSGLMSDLLDLDYTGIKDFSLHGIDLEQSALSEAKKYAEEKKLQSHCLFLKKDAWDLNIEKQFDLISSNGLNIYEPDEEKVTALYKQFYTALKPEGTLITSFLTIPPLPNATTGWNLKEINEQNALLQRILLVDILSITCQFYNTEERIRNRLEKVGFKQIKVLYDRAHIFPTVVAKK
jgi:SAM-dependent methyltransferase